MNAPTPLFEQRLRRGLESSADTVPPGELTSRDRRPPGGRAGRRRMGPLVLGGAAAAVVVVAAVLVVRDSGDGPSDVVANQAGQPSPSADETTVPAEGTAVSDGDLPGQAVVVGNELRTYGPDGAQTGAVSLAPLTGIQAASSDLAGGWVVCGMDESAEPPVDPAAERAERAADAAGDPDGDAGDGPVSSDRIMWFPAEGEPREVAAAPFLCSADSIRVVGSAEGPTLIHEGIPSGSGDVAMAAGFSTVVLATGEQRTLDLPLDPEGFYRWSAAAGRILVRGELSGEEIGPQLFDLTTGDPLPIAEVDPDPNGLPSDVALSADGATAAWLFGDAAELESDLVVTDLATGEELYRETFPITLEGAELSYDGTTVAIGNWYDDPTYPPVTVFDLANPEARYTIDAHGTIL